jgi:hypothetical protein
LFDRVTTQGWLVVPGQSHQLIPGFEDSLSNDDPQHWCTALRPLVDGAPLTATPGLPNSCDPPLDTGDSEPDDTGLPPTSARSVYMTGDVTTSPNVFWFGNIERRIGVTDITTGQETLQCRWEWSTIATGVAGITSSCPSCEFGFDVNRTGGVNRLPGTSCGSEFAAYGGTVRLLPDITFAYSSSYGALLYSVNGALEVYTYNTSFIGTSFEWRKDVETTYYY